MPRLQRHAHARIPALGHGPAAFTHQPVHVRADRVGQRGLDLATRDVFLTVGSRHRQRHDGRLTGMIGARRLQRHVAGLEGLPVAIHHRRERRIHDTLNIGNAAKALVQLDPDGPGRNEAVADSVIGPDIGPPEPVNRLLRVADDEELARHRSDVLPARLAGVGRRQEQQQIGLERIRILELVDEDPLEVLLEMPPHLRIVPQQVARAKQEVEEVERARARLERFVGVHACQQLAMQERREVGVRPRPEIVERLRQRGARVEDLRARDALAVAGTTALAAAREIAIAPQIDELRLDAIEIGGGALRAEVAAQSADRLGVDEQVVADVRRRRRQVG